MTDTEQKAAAKAFAEHWKGRGYEKGESQSFWLELLQSVYGVESPTHFIVFEEQVHLDHTSFIDGMIPSTRVMIEQKGLGKDLKKPIKQSDGIFLTPFQQAKRYIVELPVDKHPRWVVTCNFAEFWVYDMNKPGGEPEIIKLENLPKEYYRLQFLVDTGNEHLKREMEVSMAAGEIVGLLYDAFAKQYRDPTSKKAMHSLNVLCVRLVFCLYAEDAGIFGKHGMFHDYLAESDTRHMRKAMMELFQILDTPVEERDPYLAEDNPELAAFPYVNGGLFSDEDIEIFYAHLLRQRISGLTLVVITDRNDLDGQLFKQFLACKAFLREEPVQAESQEHLQTLLDGRVANGIFFSTMGKFLDPEKPFTDRKNIVVMADEAHRSQYGLIEKTKMVKTADGKEEAHLVIGAARRIRKSLPGATYIGFTGTPVSSKDHNTIEVFGNYIDVYDMTQAVEDGATRPVYYESRVVKLNLDPETLQKIDDEYDILAEEADPAAIEKSKRMLGGLDAVLSNDATIDSLVTDILYHYETTRANYLTGKAMIVAYDRKCAMKIYRKILDIHPDWTEKVKVVMTEGKKDPQDWHTVVGNKAYRDKLALAFKDDESEFKIAIVVDMWLTGFDVPSLSTMYVYKPMSGHNLMQAIARVNRVFEDKEGGLIVDYIGIAAALKQAMNDYTNRDKKNFGDPDINKQAYPKFKEKLGVCKDLLYGYDYSDFFSGDNQKMAGAILGAVNYLMEPAREEDRDDFLKQATLLKNALSLCASLATEDERYHASFMETVRVMITRIVNPGGGKISLPEINQRVNELIKQSVKSDGVVNLFEDSGETYSLFNPSFIEEVAKMKHKNIAVEVLKKLLEEQIKLYRKTNVVQSQKFSEIMQRALNEYLNGMLTNQQVIDELLKMAEEMRKAQEDGNNLNLSPEEKAFYDALTRPEAVRDFYSNDELIALTKELTETLRKNRTVDWQRKESARAKMRNIVRRLLRKYKYPPDEAEGATKTVIEQCELWADNAV